MKYTLLIALIIFVNCIEARINKEKDAVASSGTCQPSLQLFDSPFVMNNKQACSAFAGSACCDFGVATRALYWAAEDDGCGVIKSKVCQNAINDLMCHISCAPNMIVNVLPQFGVARPTICSSWIQNAYNLCVNDVGWCADLNGIPLSSCTFEQTYTTRVSNGRYSSKQITVTTINDAASTCTYLLDLTPQEFGTKILGVYIANDTDSMCSTPLVEPERSSGVSAFNSKIYNVFFLMTSVLIVIIKG